MLTMTQMCEFYHTYECTMMHRKNCNIKSSNNLNNCSRTLRKQFVQYRYTLTRGCLKVHGGVPIVLCLFVDPL